MKNLFTLIALGVGSTMLASPVLAEEMDPAKITCAEFMAGDMEMMSEQMDAMHMASPDAAMEMDAAAMETAMHGVVEHCEGKPDMMAMEAMMMK